MKTTVTGIAEWAKVFEENRDLDGFEGQWRDTNGRCTIDLILDDANFNKLKELGMMAKGKVDPEGRGKRVKVTRKFEAQHEWMSGPPQVFKSDGTKWDYATDGPIGNGSEVLVEVDIYKNGNYTNYTTRLERVKVLNLVEPPKVESKVDPFHTNTSSTATSSSLSNEIPF
jgi:hypothetical protein